MTTNIKPSKAEMVSAWEQLKCRACGFVDKDDFLSFMDSDAIHYDPILIMDEGNIEALIYFDEYDACLRTCNAHFITAKAMRHPLQAMRDSKRMMEAIMRNGDIDLLFAYIPSYIPRSVAVAELLGFKQFAQTAEYTAMTLQLDLI